ncbi:MAG: AI-2E family transporter [Zymomonas mobilis]|uniref:Putative PurR-regulated permease PerM n=1 Tax=Zymomonas mobilis TaxID=542 RepID=A0A542W362_ZYMMB|nr:AI-2E family transporter [Zymomonas mobilis]TQL18011.1 putative PurR-regulated permease PerM [Zymomonas mobilis]
MPETKKRPPEKPGPSDLFHDFTTREFKKAAVWISMAGGAALLCLLIQPILLIIAGLVFASLLDDGTRLLGHVLKIGRGYRLAIVCICVAIFLAFTLYLAVYQLGGQLDALQSTLSTQFIHIRDWLVSNGLMSPHVSSSDIAQRLFGSFGEVSAFVGNALGAVSGGAMILVIGIFVAIEPHLYERGFAWMIPIAKRPDFYRIFNIANNNLRRLMAGRLLGMAIEGVGTWLLLLATGVPMATLLGLLTGLLAFLPNIGALISGLLICLVGFSQNVQTGLWAMGVYAIVQMIDGYLIVPIVARRSVNLPPALELGAQILLGALFGVMGLALADPLVAIAKVSLEEYSKIVTEREEHQQRNHVKQFMFNKENKNKD